MGLGREEIVETTAPPVFQPGEKVMANRHVKNDGTYPGREIGDRLVYKGDVGYVRDIGTFLQQFYIYGVDFVAQGRIVGMKRRELVAVEAFQAETQEAV